MIRKYKNSVVSNIETVLDKRQKRQCQYCDFGGWERLERSERERQVRGRKRLQVEKG